MNNTINSTKRSVEMLYNSLKLQMGTDVNTSISLADNLENILQVNEAQALLNIHNLCIQWFTTIVVMTRIH